jgi:hypothetical protein
VWRDPKIVFEPAQPRAARSKRVRTLGRLMLATGGVLMFAALCLWLLGVGACDTSCGHADQALVVFGLPGLIVFVLGTGLTRLRSDS